MHFPFFAIWQSQLVVLQQYPLQNQSHHDYHLHPDAYYCHWHPNTYADGAAALIHMNPVTKYLPLELLLMEIVSWNL